jgi:disease resistance protein RPM1
MELYREFGEKFECRAFVLASQKFHLPTVLRSLIKQVHEQQSSASKNDLVGIENWSEEDLKKKLADQLKKKRCASLDFANFYRIFLLFGTIL